MKRILLSFFILSALILGAQGLFSCRSSLMQKMHSDSSSVKSEATSEKWNREIIREYLPGRIDTIHNQVDHLIEVPKIIPIPQPYYREIIRDSGEKQKQSDEKTLVQQSEKKMEKEATPAWQLIALGAGAVITLIIAARLFKSWILASIPKL